MAPRLVKNTLLQPDLTPIVGAVVEIQLVADASTGRGEGWIPGSESSVIWRKHVWSQAPDEDDLNGGLWSVELEPNANIEPANTYYKVTEDPPGRAKAETYYIQVPAGTGDLWVRDILVEEPASPEPLYLLGSQLEDHVETVKDHDDWSDTAPATGQVPIWNGSAYVPGDTVATDLEVTSAITTHNADTTDVHGIPDTSVLATDAEVASAVAAEATLRGNADSAHEADTTNIHGIADTSALVTDGDAAGGVLSGTYPSPGFAVDMATQAELDAEATLREAHEDDTTDAHPGSAITNTPAGGIAATTAQGAINELDTEKADAADARRSALVFDLLKSPSDEVGLIRDSSALHRLVQNVGGGRYWNLELEELAGLPGSFAVPQLNTATIRNVADTVLDTLMSINSAYEYAWNILPTGGTTSTFVGNVHGYEAPVSTTFYVDGVTPSLLNGQKIWGRCIEVVRVTKLRHPDTSTTDIADVTTLYRLTRDGLEIHHKETWNVQTVMAVGYSAMFPLVGATFTKGGMVGGATADYALTGNDGTYYGKKRTDILYTWGTNYAAGLYVPDLKASVNDWAYSNPNYGFIEDRDPASNDLTKLYFTRAGQVSNAETLTAGQVTRSHAIYRLARLQDADLLLARAA